MDPSQLTIVLWLAEAGAQFVSPAWAASIVHCPALTNVTVDPESVHTAGVAEERVTASPELALASTTALSPTAAVAGSPATKVTDCDWGVGVGVGVGVGFGVGFGLDVGCGVGRVGRITVGCGRGGSSGLLGP